MTGEQVKAIRQGLGLSQEQFAQTLGVSYTTVNRWERGHTQPTGTALQMLMAFSRAGEQQNIGDVVAKALVVGGAAFLLYKILEAGFREE